MKSAAYLQVETKKRPRTRGVYERTAGSGVWWIHWYDAQGRRHREKVGTKGAAIDLYRKRKTQVLEGRKLPERLRRAPVQFREIAQVALQYSSLHKRSFRDDRCRMAKLLQWFSDRAAESITAQEIEELLNNERWRPATTNRYRSLLSLVYRLAIRDGKVKDNPARLVRHRPEVNGRVRFLSREEENQIRAAILELFPEHLAEFELALHSGLRRGEQYHARWQNVDFERRVLTVPLDKSGRTSHVPLNAGALRALAELHKRTVDSDLVCGGARSSRNWFERTLEATGIRDLRWHDLRHTFASRLVMSGADLRTVAELLRDSSLAMVMRYAHLAPDHRMVAVERMEAAFSTELTATRTATEVINAPNARTSAVQ